MEPTYTKRITNFELGQLIDRVLEPFGRYQIFLTFVLAFHNGVSSIPNTIPAFYNYTPDRYRCINDTNEELVAENATCVTACRKYEFFDPDTSVVTEFSLVCDRRYLAALATTIYFVGITIGSPVCGVMSDFWGRKRMVLVCLYLQGIFGVFIYFANSLEIFILLRFIQGFFVQGLQNTSFTLLQELSPPRKLTLTALVWEVVFIFGLIFLGISAYFIRDWKLLQLITTIPTFLSLTWTWLIPESPKYLASNQKQVALREAFKIARRNNHEAMFEEYCSLQVDQPKVDTSSIESIAASKLATIIVLFRNKTLLKHVLIMFSVWFSVTLAYFAIWFYLPSLAGGRHLNFINGALVELLGYIAAFFLLSSNLGRRQSMILSQYLTALFCLGLGVLTFVPNEDTWKAYSVVSLALVGKGLTAVCFIGASIYGVELFPTVTRSTAVGVICIFSRFGSLLAPQILLLGEFTHPIVPMAIMAASLIVGGTATFGVPETLNKKLPDTVKDTDETWID